MYPTFNIGPFAFPSAGLVIIFGAYVTLWVVEKSAVRLNQNQSALYALASTALLAGFVGARLAFVAEYWAAFRENLLGIVWPLNTGYTPWAGVLIGLVAAFFYGRYKQLSPLNTLDALTPALIVGLMVVSLADFLGGPGLGTLTGVLWGISQYGIRRHAVQLYELLVGASALLVWWQFSKKKQQPGRLFLMGTAVYSAGRLFFDAYRDTDRLTASGYHITQIVLLLILLTAIFFLGLISESRSRSNTQAVSTDKASEQS
ncbi:MAG: prolipoprotein diacylglyceryl transferase [Anaerolineales bacterium]|nr:prolipoprotein diacylglyceryl transferase [Anaerolineales bacterium]